MSATLAPKRTLARKFSHDITPDEIEAIRIRVSAMPGSYTVEEGAQGLCQVVIATPSARATCKNLGHGLMESRYPTITFRKRHFYQPDNPEVLISAYWPGMDQIEYLPTMRSLEGALSILPALAAQWVRT